MSAFKLLLVKAATSTVSTALTCAVVIARKFIVLNAYICAVDKVWILRVPRAEKVAVVKDNNCAFEICAVCSVRKLGACRLVSAANCEFVNEMN